MLPLLPTFPLHLQRSLVHWASLLWQGESTDSFPESDHQWIEWLRHTGLAEWQRATMQPQAFATLSAAYTHLVTPTAASGYSSYSGTETRELATLTFIPTLSDAPSVKEAVLLVPPCTHKSTIFNISPEASLVNQLVQSGYQVVVLEWHTPGSVTSPGSSENLPSPGWQDYRSALSKAIQEVYEHFPHLHIMGLCLGGVMVLECLTHPHFQPSLPTVQSLTLLSTLLDYHVSGPLSCLHWPPVHQAMREWLEWVKWIPAPVIYAMCCLLMPSPPVKGSPLSEWSQQGLHVSSSLALELLEAFYASNHLLEPNVQTASSPLSRLKIPLYAVAGLQDRLVPVHGLFNGLHHCSPSLPIRLSLFEAGHLRSFLSGRILKGHQADWKGQSVEGFLASVPVQSSSSWIEDWKHWTKRL